MTTRILATEPVQQTKVRIADCAKRLFWLQGYHPVSTDAICRAAGVRKGSLYHAFASKEEVLLAALESVFQTTWKEIPAIHARQATPLANLRDHLRWFTETQRRMKDEHGKVLGSFDIALGVGVPQAALDLMVRHRKLYVALMRQTIGKLLGLSAEHPRTVLATRIVRDVITGAMVQARLENDLHHLEQLPDMAIAMIELLIGKPLQADQRAPEAVSH